MPFGLPGDGSLARWHRVGELPIREMADEELRRFSAFVSHRLLGSAMEPWGHVVMGSLARQRFLALSFSVRVLVTQLFRQSNSRLQPPPPDFDSMENILFLRSC